MKSFTLIELLITTTIIFVFSTLSLAYYNNFNQYQILKKEARQLVNTLELAKKKAGAGDLSNQVCEDGFNGYQVNITTTGYSLWLVCGGTPGQSAIFSYNFPSNNISVSSGAGQYNFRELNINSSYGTIRIKNSAIAKCLDVTISFAGIITLSDNFISC